jgi:8-amino-7-oxononanoate synthase
MADFSSALYLGLRHPAAALPPWRGLTLGKPAALASPPGAAALATELAALQGCQAATLLPSTLHLFWDLFGMLARGRGGAAMPAALPAACDLALPPYVTLVDGGAYQVARWGAQYGAACGMPMAVFARHDARAAAALARHWHQLGRRPVVLADGYCPGAPAAPPLAAYLDIAAEHGGLLVLDDTQVLGVLGDDGGGSLRGHGLMTGYAGSLQYVLLGASLAKGFGAPLAALSGSHEWVTRFEACSQTRRHCSPPSVAAIAAGLRALRLNRHHGDVLRRRLALRVAQLRSGLHVMGWACSGGQFPVQTLHLPEGLGAVAICAALARERVLAVPQALGGREAISFVVRADHSQQDVAQALDAVRRCLERL